MFALSTPAALAATQGSGAAGGFGAGAAAGAGGPGLFSILGAGAQGLGALGQLGMSIYGLLQGGRLSPEQKRTKMQWEAMQVPAAQLYRQLYYNPTLAGTMPPYPTGDVRQQYQWAPTPAMRSLYTHYLNRQYGLPTSVARSQIASALGPLRAPTLPRGAITPGLVGAQVAKTMTPPATMARAVLATRMPEAQRQQDYLKGAAELAAFNLWRAQQLSRITG